jgi:hypothetical protein
MFLGRKSRTTLDLLLPTKEPAGHDEKMERQFNRRHGAVARKFEVGDTVQERFQHTQDWRAASVKKRVGGRLYNVTLTHESILRFHVKQMRSRYTHNTADNLADFLDGFNLTVPHNQVAR